MSRIAIVGHPSSGYQEVEALLKLCGMADAALSRREGMSVHEIQQSLCKAHGVPLPEQAQQESDLAPLELSPVWQGLALDLLLGNMEQAGVWGWAAPNTLPLLKLWHEVDAQTQFVLIYQHPASALQHSSTADPEPLLNNWAAYHGALLSFYLRHPERCLLVHSQQLLQEPERLLDRLPQLVRPAKWPARAPAAATSSLAQALAQSAMGPSAQQEEIDAAPLAAYLHQQVVEHHPALSIYQELQACASQPASEVEPISIVTAWQHWQAQRRALVGLVNHSQQKWQDAQDELKRAKAECNRLKDANAALQQQIGEPASEALQQENAMLLEQLHRVQEALESLHQGAAVAQPSLSRPREAPHYGADERIKRQLTYRLGAVVVRSNSLKEYLMLPLALKREHKAYLQDKQARQGENLPPVERYADAYKAEQVKQHLSYRLGRIIMANGGSPIGWIKLPFALASEARAFRKERAS